MTVTEDHPIIGSTLYKAYEDNSLHQLVEQARREGRVDELIEQVEALRELYEAHPKDVALGRLVGELQQARIERNRREAAEKAKPRMEAERKAADEQYAIDRELGALSHGAFERFVSEYYGGTCPNDDADRPPHRIEGYLHRAGHRWTCTLCGFEGDALPLWREKNNQEAK